MSGVMLESLRSQVSPCKPYFIGEVLTHVLQWSTPASNPLQDQLPH